MTALFVSGFQVPEGCRLDSTLTAEHIMLAQTYMNGIMRGEQTIKWHGQIRTEQQNVCLSVCPNTFPPYGASQIKRKKGGDGQVEETLLLVGYLRETAFFFFFFCNIKEQGTKKCDAHALAYKLASLVFSATNDGNGRRVPGRDVKLTCGPSLVAPRVGTEFLSQGSSITNESVPGPLNYQSHIYK